MNSRFIKCAWSSGRNIVEQYSVADLLNPTTILSLSNTTSDALGVVIEFIYSQKPMKTHLASYPNENLQIESEVATRAKRFMDVWILADYLRILVLQNKGL